MMSAMRLTHCRNLFLLVATFLTVEAFAAQPIPNLACRLPSGAYLLGEPINLEVRLKWENPTPGLALVTAQSFLRIELHTSDGKPVVSPPDWAELYYENDDDGWRDRTIVLTSADPEWTKTIHLNDLYRFDTPDTYLITASWNTPIRGGGEEIDARLLRELPSGHIAHLLEEYSASAETTVEILCPETDADRQAFEFLTGEPCPEAFLSLIAVQWEDDRLSRLVESFPTSTYAGYALAKGHGGLPYSKPPDQSLIEALGSGDYLREHPEITMFLKKPRIVDSTVIRRETVRTEPRIRAHIELLSEFIALHPEFSLRHRLEMMLGFDRLALGDADEAESHWRWVVEHSPDAPFRESAQGYLEDLRTLRAKMSPASMGSP